MITSSTDPADGVVEFTVAGSISREEYDRIVADMDKAIATFGKLRLIEVIEEVGAIDSSIWWKDVTWAWHHLKDVARCAVVTDKGWIGPVTRAAGALIPAEVRVFPLADIEGARAWVRAGD